ncbi:MAG TPA: hypothetical protein VE398_15050 [Acidobacteriota bacterium]|nr:hypothetical protein [Acidobacteriota bacterium]
MRAYGWFGLALLVVSEYFLYRKVEPFYSWFYCFAWWSYVLLADNLLLRLRGSSLLSGRQRELRSMLPLSVFIWLLFEGYNFIIRDWAYDGVPHQLWLRWIGYAISFATVLPAVFISSDLVETMFARRGRPLASECEKLAGTSPTRPSLWLPLIGLLLCVAPLLWPRSFFPAVWLWPIFLLDPLLERLGVRSLSLLIAGGERRRIWSLLLGGLLCGLMWEFWNFWAASKWVYTVPFFGNWRVFEMPLLGFLGFPPFALECWILYHVLRAILERPRSALVRIALWAVIAVLCVAVFYGIDARTVVRFADQFHGNIYASLLRHGI